MSPHRAAPEPVRTMISISRESALAHRFLDGLHGIEIGGSACNPFNIPNCRNVDYTDDTDTIYKREERRLAGTTLPVDVVARGDVLPFADGSLDYVLSSHVLEHFIDPLAALIEWQRVLRPGGILFAIVPHRDRTFDRDRPRTSLRELIDRHAGRITLPAEVDEYEEHHSVWITDDVMSAVEYLGFGILAVDDVDDKVGNGFTIVCEKRAAPDASLRAAELCGARRDFASLPFTLDSVSVDAEPPINVRGQRHVGLDLKSPSSLRLYGWVFDRATRVPISSILAAIDGQPVRQAYYGLARADVAAFYADPALLPVGFSVGLHAPEWQPGYRHVTLHVADPEGTSYCELDVVICARVRD